MQQQTDGLQTLIELQQIDSSIHQVRRRQDEIPRELEALAHQLQLKAEETEHANQLVEEQRKLRRQIEGEVSLLREKLTKFKTQLMEVKTNREYQAVLHEISVTEGEITLKEDQILESMLSVEEQLEEAGAVTQRVASQVAELEKEKKALETYAAAAEVQIKELTQQRDVLLAAVPEGLGSLYRRIAAARGVALAEARDDSCQVCHVRLRPQLFTEVKGGQRIITCENCNRILYYVRS